MGAGLHINHVPGFLGVKRSLSGSSAQRGRALRNFQSSDFVIAGGAPLSQEQRFINFFFLRSSHFWGLEEKKSEW